MKDFSKKQDTSLITSVQNPIESKKPLLSTSQTYLERVRESVIFLQPYLVDYLHILANNGEGWMNILLKDQPKEAILRRGVCVEATGLLEFMLRTTNHEFNQHQNSAIGHYILASQALPKIIVDPSHLQHFHDPHIDANQPKLCAALDALFLPKNLILIVHEHNFKEAAQALYDAAHTPLEKAQVAYAKFSDTPLDSAQKQALISRRYAASTMTVDEIEERLSMIYDLENYFQSGSQAASFMREAFEGKKDALAFYLQVACQMRKDGIFEKKM